jgi:hypothetical protein
MRIYLSFRHEHEPDQAQPPVAAPEGRR